MTNLLYKEFKLSINTFFFIAPVLFGALFLIPQWPFFIALMYFFFISVPNIYVTYNSQNDNGFSLMMPVKKSEIVKAKMLSFISLEMLHLIAGAVFAVIHIYLYKTDNFTLDLNSAFFGIAFMMFALFNSIFFPLYFRTAYNYGIPTIAATVISILFVTGIELLVLFNSTFAHYLEGKSSEMRILQLFILLAGIIIFGAVNLFTYWKSANLIDKIDL